MRIWQRMRNKGSQTFSSVFGSGTIVSQFTQEKLIRSGNFGELGFEF